jgi:hypothetical protein
MPAAVLHASLLSSGFGGVGPVAIPGSPDAWVTVFLEIQVSEPLTGVQIESVALLDANGGVVAHAVAPGSAARDDLDRPAGRSAWDLSDTATGPFDGNMAVGTAVRLRLKAALDVSLEGLVRAGAVRTRADVTADGHPRVSVEGPLQTAWCTAGPATPDP